MINDSLEDFKSAVAFEAEDYRKRSFEACMESFLKNIIKKSIDLDVPNKINEEDKLKLANEVKGTIDESVKQIVGNALSKDDTDKPFNVNIANDIVNPKDFASSVSKAVANSVFDEANDRTSVLEAQKATGVLDNKTSEEVLNWIKASFEDVNFDKRYGNNTKLNAKLKTLFSVEGEELVNSIKDDVLSLIDKTESKNSIIREAVADINCKKEEIEKTINGDKDESETTTKDTDSSTEGFTRNLLNDFRPITKRDLYIISDVGGKSTFGAENFEREIDSTSFSRESAEDILKQFQQLDDGIDVDSVPANDNTLSVSEDDTNKDVENPDEKTDKVEGSKENEYRNDDDEVIEPDTSKFEYDDEDAEPLSEEGFARDFIPLSVNKMINITPVIQSNKFAAFLAVSKDRGAEFFDNIHNRAVLFNDIMSKEDAVCDAMAKDEIDNKLTTTLGLCNQTELKVKTITEDLGILGILDGEYQRTDDPIDNAIKSLANPALIQRGNVGAKSKEALEENDYAEIFKLALKLSDIQSNIAKGIDVYNNKQDLGDIEALLNEKIYEIPVEEKKFDVESKVKALQSLESIIPFQDIVNMQAFVSKSEGKSNPERIVLNSIKDIDAYGYSYIDEIEKIKSDISTKFKDVVAKKSAGTNFNIDKLVEYIVEQQDTTKIDANLYEKVISKLIEDKTIETSTEGMIIRNKAKTIVACFVSGDKLGLLSNDDHFDLDKNLM